MNNASPTLIACQSGRSGKSHPIILGLLLMLSLFAATQALGVRRERLIDTWRPVRYSVNITLNDDLSEISTARTEITIEAVKNISIVDLDFGDLSIDSVSVGGEAAKYDRKPGLLKVKLPQPQSHNSKFSIVVAYHGVPKDGLILTDDKDGKPSAVGDNWPNRVHHWIPCLDHPSAKAPVTFTVTAPEKNLVVANGKLDRVAAAADDNRTWTYTEADPIPPYCMIIAVGRFAKVDSGKPAGSPLSYYVPQTDRKYATKGFAPAAPALRFFSQTVAPYPYEKLALIIGATKFGGMENSSAIVFTTSLFDPSPGASVSRTFGIRSGIVDVVAHEIAHQWFGDSVTESTWADLWLSEGFATYFAGLFIQHTDGEKAFQEYMQQAAQSYFHYEQRSRTPIFDRDTEDLFKLLNPNNYQKGAWVLHMLRMSLGDDAFFKGIRQYYETHKTRTANSDDLRAALEKSSGQNLKDFFARWVYGTGHPQYGLIWSWDEGRKEVVITLRQLQSEPAFPNPLPIQVVTESGKQRFTLHPMSKDSVERFPLGSEPLSIDVDPTNTVLKEISLKAARKTRIRIGMPY